LVFVVLQQNGSPSTLRLIAWAQRNGHVLPRPLRHAASRAVRRLNRALEGTVGLSEDWCQPLIVGRNAADLEALRPEPPSALDPAAAAPRSPTVSTSVNEPPIRCAVATGILDVGGGGEVAGFLARHLPTYGFETVVIHTGAKLAGQAGPGGRLLTALTEAGIQTIELAPETADEWFGSYRPQVVHGNYAPTWMLDAAVRAGAAWVETLHGMHNFLSREAWAPERVRSTAIAAQVAISDLVRRQYLAGNPAFPADRIVTIPNGTEPARYAPVDRERARAALGLEDEFLFVSTARYCLQKNTFGLVAAFAEAVRQRAEAHLLVAGRPDDPVYVEHVRTLARREDRNGHIHLRGHCENVPALLAAADAFVLNSFFEGAIPLSSMEAMAAGLPVIMSDVGGAREQLGWAGDRGCLVPNPGGEPELVDWARMGELRLRPQPNKADLVNAIVSVVDRREYWAASRVRLRDAAAELFPPELSARRHAAVLRSVVRGEPLPVTLLATERAGERPGRPA
jgi:glycosyltransferase involved in cell wall biosynthesis